MIKRLSIVILLHLVVCQDEIKEIFRDNDGKPGFLIATKIYDRESHPGISGRPCTLLSIPTIHEHFIQDGAFRAADQSSDLPISTSREMSTVESLKCAQLEGTTKDCLACYPCDDKNVKNKKKPPRKLSYTLSNCTKLELCCVKLPDLSARASDDNCGKHNPQGDPRSRRPSLRSVLEREYPWRAWVYRSDNQQVLCAASYVYEWVWALMTTASCVKGYQPSDLVVKFTKNQKTPSGVNQVVIHENFTNINGANGNDIALLILNEKPDTRVKPVCTETNAPLLGSPCVIVSDSETYINTVVPHVNRCRQDKVKVNDNLMCTYSVKGDYTPQKGAGLYCINEHAATPIYTLYGIYLADQSKGQLSVYTSVHNYTNWAYKTGNLIKQSKRN